MKEYLRHEIKTQQGRLFLRKTLEHLLFGKYFIAIQFRFLRDFNYFEKELFKGARNKLPKRTIQYIAAVKF